MNEFLETPKGKDIYWIPAIDGIQSVDGIPYSDFSENEIFREGYGILFIIKGMYVQIPYVWASEDTRDLFLESLIQRWKKIKSSSNLRSLLEDSNVAIDRLMEKDNSHE